MERSRRWVPARPEHGQSSRYVLVEDHEETERNLAIATHELRRLLDCVNDDVDHQAILRVLAECEGKE